MASRLPRCFDGRHQASAITGCVCAVNPVGSEHERMLPRGLLPMWPAKGAFGRALADKRGACRQFARGSRQRASQFWRVSAPLVAIDAAPSRRTGGMPQRYRKRGVAFQVINSSVTADLPMRCSRHTGFRARKVFGSFRRISLHLHHRRSPPPAPQGRRTSRLTARYRGASSITSCSRSARRCRSPATACVWWSLSSRSAWAHPYRRARRLTRPTRC